MPVHRIDHVNLNSSDVARTCAFYVDVLGFEEAKPMGTGGAWIYLQGHPYLHVGARAPGEAPDALPRVDHFALQASDVAATRARLEAAGVPFREASYAQLDIHQIVVHDPDGVKVELNFKGQAA
jgi:catechol 2,3-dioxygenase-like lactoylglutathione lyase family enzyme